MSGVRVTAPARLHLGMLDVPGGGHRRYGGIGVGIEGARVVVEATAAEEWSAEGPDGERALAFARRCADVLALPGAAQVNVVETIPAHVGLGSGTKLGLAVARAISELHGLTLTAPELARVAGRGARSAVGLWTFADRGLVVEGGVRRDGGGGTSALLARMEMPSQWRCVLVLQREEASAAVHGSAEEQAFAALARDGAAADGAIAQQVLTALLPGLAEGDVEEFGAALTRIQQLVGAAFAGVQGGTFHPRAAPVVEALSELGVPGVGQSSWGPTVYGIIGSQAEGERAAAALAGALGERAEIAVVRFADAGARVEAACASV